MYSETATYVFSVSGKQRSNELRTFKWIQINWNEVLIKTSIEIQKDILNQVDK